MALVWPFLLPAILFLSFFSSSASNNGTSLSDLVSRPVYHFRPIKSWLNDPCGPMYYKGYYHQFYQYNPYGALWANITWGHSISTDLVNWIQLKPAIEPGIPSDKGGCWTGSATLVSNSQPVILYTGGSVDMRQSQNLAFPKNLSDPYLREWTKARSNPVILPDGPGMNSTEFRDPTTGWIGPDGLWRIAVGGQLNGHSAAFLYKSEDFLNWARVDHPLYSHNGPFTWECPDFFAVLPGNKSGLDLSAPIPEGAKHTLKMSVDNSDKYIIGVYDLNNDAFVPDTVIDDHRLWLRIDYGIFYASKTFYDSKKGRRIVWGWSTETDSQVYDVAKGWAGIHAIPRAIWLDSDGNQLLQWPVSEIDSLRTNEINHQGLELNKGDLFEIEGIDTFQADVEIDFELTSIDDADPFDLSWLLNPVKHCEEAGASVHSGIGPFGLVVLASDNMEEHTDVHFRVYKSQQNYMVLMCSDQRRSSVRSGLNKTAYGGFFEFDFEKERKISLRTLIDRSAVESFGGGGRVCITTRVYPVALVRDVRAHIYAFNNGSSTVRVPQLKAWSMRKAQVNVV